jgi:hypothetical protein
MWAAFVCLMGLMTNILTASPPPIRVPLHPHVHPGNGMKNSKDIQEPQNHENDYDGIQDRLDGPGHRYEAINQPEKNTNYDQSHEYLS